MSVESYIPNGSTQPLGDAEQRDYRSGVAQHLVEVANERNVSINPLLLEHYLCGNITLKELVELTVRSCMH